MNGGEIGDRIERLERRLRVTQCFALLVLIVSIVLISSLRPLQADRRNDGVLRVRGLIITDAKGRERILIGAPIPEARNRVRTDMARVKETWGKRFPAKYLDYYRKYQHLTNGILILDENGFDRIVMGDPVPDPNIGKRIAPSTGLVINDEQGFERSGYGLLNVEGNKRIVFGLDSAKGSEGLTLFLMDNGPTGISVGEGKQAAFLGGAPAKHWATGLPDPFFGLLVRGPNGAVQTYPAHPGP